MRLVQILSKLYLRVSGLLRHLPLHAQVKLDSWGRLIFMQYFIKQRLGPRQLPTLAPQVLWGIEFRNSLFNSAGMFKNGEAYDVVAALGAGAYIGGTSTANPRSGNLRVGIKLPFISLHHSRLALNFLGLPNLGDEILAHKQFTQRKIAGCPIGWSVMRSPDYDETEGVERLIQSLFAYQANSQIDFIEINESCPNIRQGGGNILARLSLISERFLAARTRNLPVIVKLSNDLSLANLEEILTGLVELKFDGINLGNTSTNYSRYCEKLTPSERKAYDYFTQNFGGGVSGAVLKSSSLELCRHAQKVLRALRPEHEFNVIRSGGIDCSQDLLDSAEVGVSLNQWYTGFFQNYTCSGNDIYSKFFANTEHKISAS